MKGFNITLKNIEDILYDYFLKKGLNSFSSSSSLLRTFYWTIVIYFCPIFSSETELLFWRVAVNTFTFLCVYMI